MKNLGDLTKDILEPCPCSECLSMPGFIYRIKDTEYRVRYSKTNGTVRFWNSCPWEKGKQISFEDIFEMVEDQLKMRLIYHLEYFK